MQLNSTNGRVIIINDIFVRKNRVDYTIYEYGGSSILRNRSHSFASITLTDYLNQTINYETLCYETLATELGNGYVTSSDIQNWVVTENASATPTTLRVYVPSTTLSEVYHSGNELDLLLKQMENIFSQVVKLYGGFHIYLVSLSAAHRLILEGYPEITIENKV